MGPRNGPSKKKGNKSGDKKNRFKKAKEDVPVEQLIVAAETAMASLDVEKAGALYSQVAGKLRNGLPQHHDVMLHVLQKLGECNVSVGDQEGARLAFQEALAVLGRQEKIASDSANDSVLYHETRSNLLLYLGQLCTAEEALETYKKGIQSLETCLSLVAQSPSSMEDEDSTEQLLKQKISGAYCTIAELYLTDLCYDDNAESLCQAALEKALQIKDADGEPFIDANQTMGSLRLSQKSRQLEAVPFILRAYEKMKTGSEALASLVGLGEEFSHAKGACSTGISSEEAVELNEVDAANNLPEFEFRCQTAKLLLECVALLRDSESSSDSGIASRFTSVASEAGTSSQEDQCLSAAISVLGSLLAQNDEVIEIWYLTGCAFAAKRPEPLADAAKFYLDRADQMLQDTRKVLKQELKFAEQEGLAELTEELEENKVQIEDVEAKLAELGFASTLQRGKDNMEE